jgi:hypothetical protein
MYADKELSFVIGTVTQHLLQIDRITREVEVKGVQKPGVKYGFAHCMMFD